MVTCKSYTRHQALIDTLDEWLIEAQGRLGLIGTGSFFLEQHRPDSDVDLIIIKHAPFYEKRVIEKDGILFDITVCSPAALNWFCEKSYHKVQWQQSLVLGKVLEDKTGKIHTFISKIERSLESEPVSSYEIRQLKGSILNNMRKLEQNQGLSFLKMRTYTDWIINIYQLLCIHKGVVAKRHLPIMCADIAQNFPQLNAYVCDDSKDELSSSFLLEMSDFTQKVLSQVSPEITDLGVYKRLELSTGR